MLTSAAALSTLLFILAGGAVGLRLTALAFRTREVAEAMLGPGLFLVVGVGYPLLMVGQHLTKQGSHGGPVLMTAALLVMSVGWSFVWTFTWRVFRPEELWARLLSSAAYLAFAVCGVEAVVRTVTFVHPQDVLIPSWGALGHQANAMVLFVWTGLESFRYHGMLKKRVALGLASPVVVNRFLLWGVVAIFAFISMAGPLVAGLQGLDFMGQPLVLMAVAVGGSTAAVALYLAFLPPKAYLRYLDA